MIDPLSVLIGAAIGAIIIGLIILVIFRGKMVSLRKSNELLDLDRIRLEKQTNEYEDSLYRTKENLNGSLQELAVFKERISTLEERLVERTGQLQEREHQCQRIESDFQILRADYKVAQEQLENERARGEERLKDLEQAREELSNQFKSIATEILKKNTEQAALQQGERMNLMLKPLSEHLQRFEKQVRETHEKNIKERGELQGEIKQLISLNKQMSADAENLTRALKGDSKTRGDWGELILSRLLEEAGLQEGREFSTQRSMESEDGRKLQPDVVINMPDQRSLVIDSKVNLISWANYCDAEDEEEREELAKQLLIDIRRHVKSLDTKAYQNLYELNTVDFVLMFIPIEGAFIEALSHDNGLYSDALNANVVIVSPTTLLATLRTVSVSWRYELQHRNAQRIAEEAGKLHDKFIGFLKDFDSLGKRIEQVSQAYHQSKAKVDEQPGNLIRRTSLLKELGAKTSKQMDQDRVNAAREAGDEIDDNITNRDEVFITDQENND